MTKLENIANWLADRQRKYADGLAIFAEFASDAVKSKCEKYFNEVKEEPNQFDPHFTMLVSKVSDIFRNISLVPDNYPEATKMMEAVIDSELTGDVKAKFDALSLELKTVSAEKQELEDRIDELEDSEEDKESEIEELESQLEEKEEKILQLQSEIDKLSEQSGIKIVAEKDLPKNIAVLYDRIKEITPLIASLHADLTKASTDDERKVIANELCKLDDERRANWDKIDDWSVGKNLKIDEPKPEYSADQLIRGQQIQIRLGQLKLNIERSQASIVKFQTEGKKNKEAGAQARLDAYTKEFNDLTAELNAGKSDVK
jgi:chromosome segregation ATPase